MTGRGDEMPVIEHGGYAWTEWLARACEAREYGESPVGRVAHIYRADEDVSLCGVELVRGVTDVTAGTLCRKCERLADA